MTKKAFQAESKRLMDLMVNSIYTNKEIFLRELISNASDAMDKMYYQALSDENLTFHKEDYFIRISADRENRTLTIEDHGIGMTEEELEENLGVIAKSGSYDFKQSKDIEADRGIIGQFGVGFYSSFMVAKKVEVLTRSYKEDQGHRWISEGAEGYEIEDAKKETSGTIITLYLRDNGEEENYDEFLEPYRLKQMVKHYSNYIRYPIQMLTEHSRLKEGSDSENPEYETYLEDEVLNSMVPIWRKNKKELTEEDYTNFYHDRHFGFDEPLHTIHMNVEGNIAFQALLYIPSQRPFDFYTKDYHGGLELYSNGVLIMERAEDLLPDYLSFVKGVVDSEDISLNISREILQQDRQLRLIRRHIEKKIIDELKKILDTDREKYESFFQVFGQMIKAGVYDNFGRDGDKLKDLLIFPSTAKGTYRTLCEYVKDMKPDQKFIYYANGESVETIRQLPQIKTFLDKEYEVLALTDHVDEFAVKMLRTYEEKEFKSISSSDVGFDSEPEKEEKNTKLLDKMKEILGDEVLSIRENKNLKGDASYLSSQGEISIDMEKTLRHMPGTQDLRAQKILEINPNHSSFRKMEKYYNEDPEKFKLYTNLLYNQARLIAGLEIEDPIGFVKDITELM